MNFDVSEGADWKYKEVLVEQDFQKTCTNPGKCTLSVTEGRDWHDKIAPTHTTVPNYKNRMISDRISYELGCSHEKAEELFDDVVKFLWAASQSDEDCLPPPAIDEGWHIFILFTKDYAEFCEKYCGAFMHHSPGGKGDNAAAVTLLQPTIDLMHKKFGRKPSKNWDYVSLKTWLAASEGYEQSFEAA